MTARLPVSELTLRRRRANEVLGALLACPACRSRGVKVARTNKTTVRFVHAACGLSFSVNGADLRRLLNSEPDRSVTLGGEA